MNCFRLSGVQSSSPSLPVQADAIPLDQDCILPHADPIPAEQVEVSKPWVEVQFYKMIALTVV